MQQLRLAKTAASAQAPTRRCSTGLGLPGAGDGASACTQMCVADMAPHITALGMGLPESGLQPSSTSPVSCCSVLLCKLACRRVLYDLAAVPSACSTVCKH